MENKIEELNRTLREDPDFICLPRHGCSLKKVMDRFPDGVPDAVGAKALNITEDEYKQILDGAVVKLRSRF